MKSLSSLMIDWFKLLQEWPVWSMALKVLFRKSDMAKELRILKRIASGLLPHQNEFHIILDIDKVDLCVNSETNFAKQSLINFRGYSVHHTIYTSWQCSKEDNAIIISNNIQYHWESKYEFEHTHKLLYQKRKIAKLS